ncbi:hypothetical protein EHO60_14870 [Leptospira fletcheri]|uniref:Histidine kinase N-terminal 7TM region domain-containing protein n=1 Tax=Leptospira fletcheri TaxID=2484981 RepID=A0A4R9G597_9LEPT|nr:histidine kinase N-terminal 7TM domain-containing protein [Leptospira fletcheri]TGK06325.1 hypothetical protein EHO60_14870 [Leptospira fletcheri]
MQWVSLFSAIFVLYLGIHVFRMVPKKPVQKYFLLLCICFSLWGFLFSFRGLLPLELKNLALNITVIPVLFAPYLFYRIVWFITEKEGEPKTSLYVSSAIVLYLVGAALSSKMGVLTNPETFEAKGFLNYHLANAYCVLFSLRSMILLSKSSYEGSGMVKVRSALLLAGCLLGIWISIGFVYILPFFGLNKSYLASTGSVIFALSWSVAIIHFDAFQVRERVLEGSGIPILKRITLGLVMQVYRILDPIGYNLNLQMSHEKFISDLLDHSNYLLSIPGSRKSERTKILRSRFKRYIR